MKKKILSIVVVILIAALALIAYNTFFAPETTVGEKSVTIHIIAESQNIDETFEVNTDSLLLFDLLQENEEVLKLEYESYDFGPMITGFLDYTADSQNQEYYHILVNGSDAETGPNEIPVNDGDVYTFELRTW